LYDAGRVILPLAVFSARAAACNVVLQASRAQGRRLPFVDFVQALPDRLYTPRREFV
jgi:hypothetical protein